VQTQTLTTRKMKVLQTLSSTVLLIGSLFVTTAMSLPSTNVKTIYGIPGSGWTSPQWQWGYGVGTGHDCAAICRRLYEKRQFRVELVEQLIESSNPSNRVPANFEEVKLVLALVWQNGRWNGKDGGEGGYGEVLQEMASARRYENGPDGECSGLLVRDMARRFPLLNPSGEQQKLMDQLLKDADSDYDFARRRCSGLVLQAMGFVEQGC
jgi:hypothetical protein